MHSIQHNSKSASQTAMHGLDSCIAQSRNEHEHDDMIPADDDDEDDDDKELLLGDKAACDLINGRWSG